MNAAGELDQARAATKKRIAARDAVETALREASQRKRTLFDVGAPLVAHELLVAAVEALAAEAAAWAAYYKARDAARPTKGTT